MSLDKNAVLTEAIPFIAETFDYIDWWRDELKNHIRTSHEPDGVFDSYVRVAIGDMEKYRQRAQGQIKLICDMLDLSEGSLIELVESYQRQQKETTDAA